VSYKSDLDDLTGFQILVGCKPGPYRPRTPVLLPDLVQVAKHATWATLGAPRRRQPVARVDRPDPPTSLHEAELSRDLDAALRPETPAEPTKRRWGHGPPQRACAVCGEPFLAWSKTQETCSRQCGGTLRTKRAQMAAEAAYQARQVRA
jgi:predicted nucleic acid-binding Zn ribbon protein